LTKRSQDEFHDRAVKVDQLRIVCFEPLNAPSRQKKDGKD
jgi:hypothetical protein